MQKHKVILSFFYYCNESESGTCLLPNPVSGRTFHCRGKQNTTHLIKQKCFKKGIFIISGFSVVLLYLIYNLFNIVA